MPERFIDVDDVLTDDHPAQYVFGLGRRGYPGRRYGEDSVWSAIVTMLATLDISSVKDDQGTMIDFIPQFTTGLTHYPVVFPCSISTRSRIHSGLVDALRNAV
ncbi:hypothetical protein DFH29DRAFT_103952 [Suillus ampliporus]|nr:hypothetical protein DFH29DRAFT_103952 [Suillus ampliporus]